MSCSSFSSHLHSLRQQRWIARTLTISGLSLILTAASSSHLPNFKCYTSLAERKQKFITYLLPLVQEANKQILHDREKLLALSKHRREWLDPFYITWLHAKCNEYHINHCDLKQDSTWTELLNKIDILPNALVLAQAAIESGWGTSRFAREGNNLFGQWCFSSKCNIVPHLDRTVNGSGLRSFSSPQNAIAAYLLNINSSASYAQLRSMRHNLHNQDQPLVSTVLANGLNNYSIRGQDYIIQIKTMITNNDLLIYDDRII